MIRKARRGVHRRPDDATGRRVVTVLLALVAAAGTTALVFTSVAGKRTANPVPLRVQATATVDPAVRQGCEVTVARARQAVDAAQPSYSHWSGHVRAQLDYDSGAATLEQTRARWAATKATADADIAAFRSAYGAYDAVRNGCAEPSGATPSSVAPDPVMLQCRSEFAAASAAVDAAKAVVDDWAAHVEMMKGKEHTDPQQYGRMWREMVKAAPTDLARFSSASLELTNHVDCPRPE